MLGLLLDDTGERIGCAMDGCGSPGIWVCPCQRGGENTSQDLHIYTAMKNDVKEKNIETSRSWRSIVTFIFGTQDEIFPKLKHSAPTTGLPPKRS